MGKKLLIALALSAILTGCSQKQRPDPNLSIGFEGRSISIAPYFKDFPYTYSYISKDGGKLLVFKASETQSLQTIDISKGADLRDAKDVIDIDFAKRNCWSPYYNSSDGYVYWEGDEKNDEIVNLYRTVPGSNKSERLTDVPYIYSLGFSPDGSKVAYVGRMAQYENRLDELHILDLKTLKDTLVCKDTPEYRFSWGEISWQPEGKGLLLLALKGVDRTYTNVIYVDLATGKQTVITDPSKRGSLSGTVVMSDWYDEDKAFFISDQDGYNNLYSFSLSSGKTEQFTRYTMDIEAAGYVTAGRDKCVFALQKNPIESRMIVLNPSDGKEVSVATSPLDLSFGTARDNYALMTAAGTTTKFQLLKASVTSEGIAVETIMDTPAEVQKKLIHSSVERLEIPTFDVDSATGKQRILHAYLYKPENPLPPEKRILLVESFYGGMNSYNAEYQVYADSGMYVLSAAPRGSAGFGRDFAAMNDGDLGGNETIDMITVSKYVASKLNIPSERVGVFGMSHGGYETMRLMTFPGSVNGHEASFPFGFGMEAAGFCDMNWIYRHTNIPDWITLEGGDPADSVKYAERSPINYADKITGPLLLIHGTNDNRVDIGGSSMMAEKLDSLGKPYKFVKFEGQGHGYKGLDNQIKFYSESLGFIEDYVLSKKK